MDFNKGSTSLVPYTGDLDDIEYYNILLRILNDLDIPYKGCRSTMQRSIINKEVNYSHTDYNF